MQTFLIVSLLCLVSTSSLDTIHAKYEESDEPRLFFVFGDSYADTGNSPFNKTAAWKFPYGISWPGTPAGRFSDGFVETDFLAATLGIPSPPPYAGIAAAAASGNLTTISDGVNFAVASSGVTYALGAPPFPTQVEWFAGLVKAGFFTPEALSRALVFVSFVGNDYSAYNGSTLEGLFDLSYELPLLMDLQLRTLYSLGVRNFMVAALTPFNCLPGRTFVSEFTTCDKNATLDAVVVAHNRNLSERLRNMTRHLHDSSALYLEQNKAMLYVLDHLSEFKLITGLKPCCIGRCTALDANGNPQVISLCDNPDEHFFWDIVHPTQAGWRAVVELYSTGRHFTSPARSLGDWLDSLHS